MLIRKLRRKRLIPTVTGMLKRPNHAWYMNKTVAAGKIVADIGNSDITAVSGGVQLTTDKFGNTQKASILALRGAFTQSLYSGTSDLTVFFRVKTANINATQVILSRRDADIATQLTIGIQYVGGKYRIYLNKGTSSSTVTKVSSGELTLNTFSDVMISIKNNIVTFVIDGVEEVFPDALPVTSIGVTSWYLGHDARDTNLFFNAGTYANTGALQDLAIWNAEALSLADFNLLTTAPMSTLYSNTGNGFNYSRAMAYPNYTRGSGDVDTKYSSRSDYEFRSIGYASVPLNGVQKTGIRVLEFNRALNSVSGDGYLLFLLHPMSNPLEANQIVLRAIARQNINVWLALILDYNTGYLKIVNAAGAIVYESNTPVATLQSHEMYLYTNGCYMQINRGQVTEKISSIHKPVGWAWF